MKNYIAIGISIIALIIALFSFGGDELRFGGITNLDSLTLGENLIVTGTTTQTGAIDANGALDVDGATALDGVTVAENLNADGGVLVGGRKNYGEKASFSLTATDICDYNFISITAHTGDGDADEVGVSLSFPDDETLQADCLSSAGDSRRLKIDNTSSIATHFIDLTTTGLNAEYASTGYVSDFKGDTFIVVDVSNPIGTSISWEFDVEQISISYQHND